MANIRRFHPGEYLKDALEAMNMKANEFSARTGISERTLSALINGNGDITFDIAYKLSKYFDNSINFWVNMQTAYDLYKHEEFERQMIADDWELIKNYKKYLSDYGYISENDDKTNIVVKARRLVNVNSLSLLNKNDSFACFKEQKSVTKEVDDFAKNFWIALALNESRKKNTNSFNMEKLKNSISEIRRLTVLPEEEFVPKLNEIFESCGVSFVILPYLPKSNIYGVTKWFDNDNVMLAVSNRGGKADSFWFTLFHEIAHVLMEHKRKVLLDLSDEIDVEANKMASDMLIPNYDWRGFTAVNYYDTDMIIRFAKEEKILPCIVLGRLHREKLLPYGCFDKELSVHYKF